VAVTDRTLTEAAGLRNDIGGQADEATRNVTKAWVGAWDDLNGMWQTATADVVATQAQLGRWPHPWELARAGSIQQALRATDQHLGILGQQAGADITTAAGNATAATQEREPHVIATQLPAALITAAAVLYGSRLAAHTTAGLLAQIEQQITALTRPLARTVHDAVQREVIRGVPAAGNQPVASRLLDRVRTVFDIGATRAATIARTETVDAYRATSQAIHKANQDVVAGWIWNSRLAANTCPACWAMHGSVHPLTEPGPLDHQSGRCGRLPKLRAWSALGIGADEPPDTVPDARAVFDALPETDQARIMGGARLELLRAGKVRWVDLAVRRDSAKWRPAYVPRTVADLRRAANQQAQ
jgi:hypothetical protein